ncbi:2,3-diaminopropionate biosynthesis protein SbnB [Paenibacillus cremeus]|uniref:2,3-diaminopropionate biosynthesis protein SbnB n=1 Tax=Paenibacillus cremeus TaxID=2163881 RepID=A0A559KBJ3_9BACL|nr:2,3-diaminopropionate biosynthesis protein SbnB [Paenibacillus cremeus]TVY09491.1 2,3-diaminopropionate biosynthesis protein SbnB [Paenibacillus cremeus]
MMYLNDGHIRKLGIDWPTLVGIIESAVATVDRGDYAQPIKPYLRFREPVNRIIAMPAFVGGEVDLCGIKWIASYPRNWRKGLPRAHNTIVLNETDTGRPLAYLHSNLLNGLRTAAVSGVLVRAYLARRPEVPLRIGIIGWGPIGRLHLEMLAALVGERIERISLYDIKGIDPETVPQPLRAITTIRQDWRTVYRESNIFATCTVSEARYIDEAPASGTLLLNVSLRDYKPGSVKGIRAIIVDDWQEVCREGTDIEELHLQRGLLAENTRTIADVLLRNALADYEASEPVFFSPMGLAVFDISVAAYYWREAVRAGIGVPLPSE